MRKRARAGGKLQLPRQKRSSFYVIVYRCIAEDPIELCAALSAANFFLMKIPFASGLTYAIAGSKKILVSKNAFFAKLWHFSDS